MPIRVRSKGNFQKTKDFLNKIHRGDIYSDLHSYGEMGVTALSQATPVETGLTASSWGYRITKTRFRIGIEWFNSNDANGTPVAVLIQYGHGTGTGGYVAGTDYINPAMRPIFDQIAEDLWKKVKS